MPENVNVKICGLTDPADVPAALLAGARTLGFVFFEKSPRHLSLKKEEKEKTEKVKKKKKK